MAIRLEQGFAELLEIRSSPHAFATKLGIGVVVAQAPRLHERDNGLDEKSPAAALAVPNGEARFRGLEPPMVVHAKKKSGIDGRGLNGLAQDRSCAGFGQQLEPTWRLDADDANHGRGGEVGARLQQGRGIDRLIGVEKHDVAIGIEVGSAHALDPSEGYAKLQKRALKQVGVEVGAPPKQALAAAEVLDQAMCRHEATRRTGRMATAPKRDELRMR
jgi:riboflavin biosynthesis pyrimidine reductase